MAPRQSAWDSNPVGRALIIKEHSRGGHRTTAVRHCPLCRIDTARDVRAAAKENR